MQITRRSVVSGTVRTMDLPITQLQVARHAAGELIQNAFHNLTADQREFYMTGITAEEWDAMFSEESKS